MKYLESKDIIRLNQKILSKVEGYATGFQVPDGKEILESIVKKALEKEEPSEVAAEYLYGLNTKHVFKSANKRTAFIAAEVFLGRNGITLDLSNQEAATLSKNIRARSISQNEVEKLIKERSKTKMFC